MARSMNLKLLAICFLAVLSVASLPVYGFYGQNGNYSGFGLKFNYYKNTCPQVESLISSAVNAAYAADRTIVGGLIRLFFHDCFVRGCDGSVLLDGLNTEKQGVPNLNSLRGFEVIDAAKANVEAACPGIVSCADVVSFAARDSIILAGGVIPFGLWLSGRKDGFVSLASETLTNLPAPFLDYAQLVTAFANKGLSEYEMVILSGGHTVGRAHCANVIGRIYNFNGVANTSDPAIDPTYLPILKQKCPQNAPGDLILMDPATPTIIDTNYVNDVLRGRGLFISDNALRTTPNGVRALNTLRSNFVFSPLFTLAVLKMGAIEIKTGTNGNIRYNCRATAGVPGP